MVSFKLFSYFNIIKWFYFDMLINNIKQMLSTKKKKKKKGILFIFL